MGAYAGPVIVLSGTETRDCVIEGFTLTRGDFRDGGGICGSGSKATLRYNRIHGNHSWYFFYTGRGCVYDCDGNIEYNQIFGNRIHFGAALYGCDGAIHGNLIHSNTSVVRGGAMARCDGNIYNNTIYGNLSEGEGPALCDCWGRIWNNIVWGNRVIGQEAPVPPQLLDCREPTYCCIEAWRGGGRGNLADDPRLQSPEEGDFHLTADSPCIDAGDYINPIAPDLEGDVRPMNGILSPRGNGSEIDIGADEFPGDPIPPPDFPPLERTHPDILYVAQKGYGGQGLSWDTAFPTISKALEFAEPGDSIWIEGGKIP